MIRACGKGGTALRALHIFDEMQECIYMQAYIYICAELVLASTLDQIDFTIGSRAGLVDTSYKIQVASCE